MPSVPILTLDSLPFVALRSEFCPLKFSHRPKYLPINEGFFLPPGHDRSEDLLFPLQRMGAPGKTSFLRILKRGVEV